MNIKNLFCLSGWGYLHDVIVQDDLIARIKMVTTRKADDVEQDDIWIDCKVDNALWQQWLNDLLDKVRNHHSVLINFKAEYGAFVKAFECFTEEDLEQSAHKVKPHILSLRGKLLSIDICCIDGALIQTHHRIPVKMVGQ